MRPLAGAGLGQCVSWLLASYLRHHRLHIRHISILRWQKKIYPAASNHQEALKSRWNHFINSRKGFLSIFEFTYYAELFFPPISLIWPALWWPPISEGYQEEVSSLHCESSQSISPYDPLSHDWTPDTSNGWAVMDHNASSGFHPVNQYLDIFPGCIMSLCRADSSRWNEWMEAGCLSEPTRQSYLLNNTLKKKQSSRDLKLSRFNFQLSSSW